jgi:hypothetical protein
LEFDEVVVAVFAAVFAAVFVAVFVPRFVPKDATALDACMTYATIDTSSGTPKNVVNKDANQ